MTKKSIYLVVPCYNEEAVLSKTAERLKAVIARLIDSGKLSKKSKICFVDDGSKDKTWDIIDNLTKGDKMFLGIKLSRNKGHQNALMAGLLSVKNSCDAVITIDADLQQDENAIEEFVDKFYEGNDIVYGVRKSRNTDSFFKKWTAQIFYDLMKVLGCDILKNHADYRLTSSRVLDALSDYREANLFLRGIIPTIGFKSAVIYFDVHERFAGESKYPFKKMLAFAIDGITSFSVKPLRLIAQLGLILFFVSIIMLVYFVVLYFNGSAVTGWSTITVSIWFIGGLVLLALGIIGEYVGKIYTEVKSRPRFIIEEFKNENVNK